MDCVLHMSVLRIEIFGTSAEVFGILWAREPIGALEYPFFSASSNSRYVTLDQTITATF